MIASSRYHDAPRYIAGFDTWRDAGEDFYYDSDRAERAVSFFPNCLKHLGGKHVGEPFHLEEWQADIIRTIFGWLRDDGYRRFRRVFWYVPRKNGKTTIAAGLAMLAYYTDLEARAECYCAAADGKQASILFDMFADQVALNDDLKVETKVRKHLKRCTYRDSLGTNRIFDALNVGIAGGHGLNAHFIAYDEYHLWQQEKHREMSHSLHTSMAARMQPIEAILTTAGDNEETLCYEELLKAIDVRDGKITDDEYLPVLYMADRTDDWTAPETWAKANPNLGVSVSEHYIRKECQKAQDDVTYENVFKRLHLNIWTQQSVRWLRMEDWDACKQSDPSDFGLDGYEVMGGLDLAAVEDLTAWVMVQHHKKGLRCMGHYWMSEKQARQHGGRGVPVRQWAEEGWLTIIPGARIEYEYVKKRILADCKKYKIKTIGIDRWCAEQLRQELEHSHRKEIVEVGQSFAGISAPAKEIQRCVVGHSMDSCGDPVMRWNAGNAEIKTDDHANIKIIKSSDRRKVDAIVALANATHVLKIKKPRRPSSYRNRGSLALK